MSAKDVELSFPLFLLLFNFIILDILLTAKQAVNIV